MSLICPECGQQNSSYDVSCIKCGHPLPRVKDKQKPNRAVGFFYDPYDEEPNDYGVPRGFHVWDGDRDDF